MPLIPSGRERQRQRLHSRARTVNCKSGMWFPAASKMCHPYSDQTLVRVLELVPSAASIYGSLTYEWYGCNAWVPHMRAWRFISILEGDACITRVHTLEYSEGMAP